MSFRFVISLRFTTELLLVYFHVPKRLFPDSKATYYVVAVSQRCSRTCKDIPGIVRGLVCLRRRQDTKLKPEDFLRHPFVYKLSMQMMVAFFRHLETKSQWWRNVFCVLKCRTTGNIPGTCERPRPRFVSCENASKAFYSRALKCNMRGVVKIFEPERFNEHPLNFARILYRT